ncbi:MAG: hypothetical protein PHW91_12610 [Bacteroidales bacterium]|nr:hypothetical protein [Bacteroidales bacterium]
MKNLLFISLFIALASCLFGQGVKEGEKISTTYDRSSLTVLFVDNQTSNHWNEVRAKISKIVFSDKYNNNNLETLYISPNTARGVAQNEIANNLNNFRVAKKVVAKWYNRQPDGTMDMTMVHERGRFSATDADFLLAQTSKRGNAALEEFGNRLINLSYILVLDLKDIKTMAEAGVVKTKGWQASVTGYLFKVNFNDEVKYAFYDTWIYDDDTEEVKDQKRKAFDALDIPIEPVLQKSVSVASSQPESDTGLGLLFKPKSTEQLLEELLQKAYDETVYRIEMDIEEFKVKTALYETRPLRAKIGLKEGLQTDIRFFVYEYVYNEKTNEAEPKRRGVIRAASKSTITDNRKVAEGDMGTSQFYQVHGRKLDQGFILQQQNDLGIEVSLGAELGEIGGGYGRVDLRLGRFIGIKSLFVYLEAGFDAGDYPSASSYLPVSDESFMFLRFGGGIAKGMQLTRNLELRPYFGAGAEVASNDEISDEDAPSAIYIKPGVNLALNLKHNFQLIGGVGVYAFISNAASDNNDDIGPWDSVFLDRTGPSAFIGIKFGF